MSNCTSSHFMKRVPWTETDLLEIRVTYSRTKLSFAMSALIRIRRICNQP